MKEVNIYEHSHTKTYCPSKRCQKVTYCEYSGFNHRTDEEHATFTVRCRLCNMKIHFRIKARTFYDNRLADILEMIALKGIGR